MKRIALVSAAVAACLLSGCAIVPEASQDSSAVSQTAARALTDRQRHLAACAALEASGRIAELEGAIARALDSGVTINELKEAFSQLYAYTGFPRSLNALAALQRVTAKPRPEWKTGKPFERPALWDDAKTALQQGTDVQTRMAGRPFTYKFSPQADYYLKSHLFGDIFAGNQLSEPDRELVTVAALCSIRGVEGQLAAHKAGAVRMGNKPEQVEQLIAWLDAQGYTLKSEFARGKPNTAFAKYFVGESYLNALPAANLSPDHKSVLPMVNVTFEPGCRNNWHTHYGMHQILICVSGKGWYQEWGKKPIALVPGSVIDIPDGVKHWHGAQKDSWFQHITTHVKTSSKGVKPHNAWHERVSDEQYAALK